MLGQDLVRLLHRLGELDHGIPESSQPGLVPRLPEQSLSDLFPGLIGLREEDTLFRAEVAEEGATRDVGRGGDVVYRRGGVAPLVEQSDGGGLQGDLRLLAFALPQ